MDIPPLPPLSLGYVASNSLLMPNHAAGSALFAVAGGIGCLPVYEMQYQSSAVRIYKIER